MTSTLLAARRQDSSSQGLFPTTAWRKSRPCGSNRNRLIASQKIGFCRAILVFIVTWGECPVPGCPRKYRRFLDLVACVVSNRALSRLSSPKLDFGVVNINEGVTAY